MKIHLIGICGTGMGSLAGLLKAAGHDVRGSDQHVYPPMSTQLQELHIPTWEGFRAENLDWGPDRVVVGNVCRKDHVEVVAAQQRGIALASFPSTLEELFLAEKHAVVIAGTHGKTTTASVMAHVLHHAGRDPSFLIGGVPLNFRASWRLGGGAEFVVEGDEYDTAFFDKGSKFLHYRPRTVVLTSVEYDHADIFPDEEAVKAAFRKFVALIPPDGHLVVCSASPGAMQVAESARCKVTTYGRPGSDAEVTFEPGTRLAGGRTRIEVVRRGEKLGSLDTLLPGIYNHENLLGVAVAALGLGLTFEQVAAAARRFAGVKRRQELRGIAAGVSVIDDFAHHPTAIRETLGALKGMHGAGKLIAAFEPRSATSRRNVFQTEFVDALAVADEVVLAPLYAPEKIPADERLDVERLAASLRARDIPARMIPDLEATVGHLVERTVPGDLVVIMSSGDYGGLHDRLLTRLGDAVMPARADDRQRIGALLNRLGILHPVLDQFWPYYLVIPSADGQALDGCVAIEMIEDVGLLRMLAVVPERRGDGLGALLLDTAVARAISHGARKLFLVTDEGHGQIAAKLGFQPIDRKDVDPAVAGTAEYQLARSKTATWMRKEL